MIGDDRASQSGLCHVHVHILVCIKVLRKPEEIENSEEL